MKISIECSATEFKELLSKNKGKKIGAGGIPASDSYASILIKKTIDEIVRKLQN